MSVLDDIEVSDRDHAIIQATVANLRRARLHRCHPQHLELDPRRIIHDAEQNLADR